MSLYRPNFYRFANNDVAKLPFDHHELMAMVAPRALLVIGNPDVEWLAAESNHVSSMAAQEVWKALGVPDRFGFSIVGDHDHCRLPESQRPEVVAYVEKFLLGNESTDTDIETSPYDPNLSRWIHWETPELEQATFGLAYSFFVFNRGSPWRHFPSAGKPYTRPALLRGCYRRSPLYIS